MEYSKSFYRRQKFQLRKRDEIIAEKILDFSNLVSLALIFSQFLEDGPWKSSALFLGILILIAGYFFVWYYLAKFE